MGSLHPYCELFADLDGLHVTAVERASSKATLVVRVEFARTIMGGPDCGVVATSVGRRDVEPIDAPVYAVPARLVRRKRLWR